MTDALTGDGAPRCGASLHGLACALPAGHVSQHEASYMQGVTYGWDRDEQCRSVRAGVACRLSLGHRGEHRGPFGTDVGFLHWSDQ